ncbi:hypothetical protein CHS0354_013068 [Potamilus streckersoni]|uniref:NACHT domain-containing protein n=1 Tax=Potamilus streckersoni TaxID=2493646 RepID=A0AAE0WB24_9BIVA|nr:hypothetical protein CHS0354_013068 [Potamilus streckersoni]
MEDMMPRIPLSGVFLCNIIALQIKLALAFSWKNVSRNITSCEHDDAQLVWEYDLNPGEYVKAKTWFTGENKTAKRIAYWKDTDGLTIESAYRDRVTVTGKGNDSLILRRVTTSDEGIYTLIPSFPLSSEPDPRLALNLNIYVPPLKEKGCCKPDINVTNDELHAFLYSEQGCGKPSPILNWIISRNKQVTNVTLILGDSDRSGIYKVCVTGPSVATCFKGDTETLCTSYTVQPPQTAEVRAPFPVGVLIGASLVILVAVAAVLTAIYFLKRLQKRQKAAEEFNGLGETVYERLSLLENVLAVNFLTKELVHIYKEQTQFQKADSQINLQTEIYDGALRPDSDIDINIYRNVFQRNERSLKRILIQGEVGCGKTTWCNTLTQEWRKAHDTNNQESNDNINFLQEFKLLFNISLGKVQKFTNIKELLSYLHISLFDQLNIDVYDYIKKHNKIIIIQGLHEYTEDHSNVMKLLSDKSLTEATIIITSTPSIWGRYYQGTLIHRAVRVKGLRKDELIKRAHKILKDDRFPQAVIDEFFSSIKSNELDEFMTEPVFFPFLVEAWKMNCNLPRTRSQFLLDVLEKQIKGKVLSLVSSVDDYRFGFENSIVLKEKPFIIHCGKIVKFLGEMAFKILIDNKDEMMLSKQDFDDIYRKQNFTDAESCQFIIDFCVSINLLSIESDKEGIIRTMSFRHKVMLAFLAAIYISTLKVEEKRPYIRVIKFSKDLVEFVSFLLNQSKD